MSLTMEQVFSEKTYYETKSSKIVQELQNKVQFQHISK